MEPESAWIYDRMTLHRLMKTHPDWGSVQLAEAVGRSEHWARKWIQRFNSVSGWKIGA